MRVKYFLLFFPHLLVTSCSHAEQEPRKRGTIHHVDMGRLSLVSPADTLQVNTKLQSIIQ